MRDEMAAPAYNGGDVSFLATADSIRSTKQRITSLSRLVGERIASMQKTGIAHREWISDMYVDMGVVTM